MKNKLLKDQMQNHIHLVHTAKELTTYQTCAVMAQTRPINRKDTKLKNLITQQRTVINQERLHVYLEESFKLKKPRLDWSPIILATQYLFFNPPSIFYHTHETICKV